MSEKNQYFSRLSLVKKTPDKEVLPWHRDSWAQKIAHQQPHYAEGALEQSLRKIRSLPPLVDMQEVERLKANIALAQEGKMFVLQAGDCAERFVDCNSGAVAHKFELIVTLSEILAQSLGKPVVRIGRMAGQYAKPRSEMFEEQKGKRLPIYRGDIVNGFEFDENARRPDPKRLEQAYMCACFTINRLRTLAEAERVHLKQWIDFYTSHEALLLPYEAALTHYVSEKQSWYNLGAHTLWLGYRTQQLDSAHVEYLRGISNPLGLKVGPSTSIQQCIELIQKLNPQNQAGKIMLVTRMGAEYVREVLPQMIKTIAKEGLKIAWVCDPMHGNLKRSRSGIKTRFVTKIESEIKETIDVHRECHSFLSGLHLEVTPDNVTECLDFETESEEVLLQNYQTYCDPRLNFQQSVALTEKISKL